MDFVPTINYCNWFSSSRKKTEGDAGALCEVLKANQHCEVV